MLLLATEVWSNHGGVQRYMRMIAQILSNQSEQFRVLTLLDHDTDQPNDASVIRASCCHGSKWKFCVEALRLSRTGAARTAIVGHVGLLPLAWTLQKMNLIHRYILVLHGIEAWHRLRWISRIGARTATAVVATTRYTLREFCFHNGLENANCVVIPLACTFRLPVIHRTPLVPELRILTVTRLSTSDAYKGVDTILIALRQARQADLNVTLELVGSGNDKGRLESLTCSLKVQDAVRFRGAVSDKELEQLFRESHVFVMPSKKEGFGIAFLEAMAAGLPCIGANHGGTPEVIEHGESGFLIEYGDVDQLVSYWRMLTESPGLYKAMSHAARRRATETLSLDAMAQSWVRLAAGLRNSIRSSQFNQPLTSVGDKSELPHVAP